jgi:AraC family transcriptional regulator
MPRLRGRPLFASDGLLVRRVVCDGVDGPRPAEEGAEAPSVIFVLHGRFTFRDACVRAVASPAVGLFLRDQHTYQIRHVDGEGDLCLALRGDVCRALVAAGPTVRHIPVECDLRMRVLAGTLAGGMPLTQLAVEEGFCRALAPGDAVPRSLRPRDYAVAQVIAYEIEQRVGDRLGLSALAENAGASVFHACRVFKRATGVSIHGYQQEVRLRHALALLLDSDHAIARIAVDLGFANQAHLTNLFRRRFRVTPGRVRRSGPQVAGLKPCATY